VICVYGRHVSQFWPVSGLWCFIGSLSSRFSLNVKAPSKRHSLYRPHLCCQLEFSLWRHCHTRLMRIVRISLHAVVVTNTTTPLTIPLAPSGKCHGLFCCIQYTTVIFRYCGITLNCPVCKRPRTNGYNNGEFCPERTFRRICLQNVFSLLFMHLKTASCLNDVTRPYSVTGH